MRNGEKVIFAVLCIQPQSSAVTSTEFEYLSKSTSNWTKSYSSKSKSNAQKVTRVKVKK